MHNHLFLTMIISATAFGVCLGGIISSLYARYQLKAMHRDFEQILNAYRTEVETLQNKNAERFQRELREFSENIMLAMHGSFVFRMKTGLQNAGFPEDISNDQAERAFSEFSEEFAQRMLLFLSARMATQINNRDNPSQNKPYTT